MHIEEPSPRQGVRRVPSILPHGDLITSWSRDAPTLQCDFWDVLGRRRSSVAGPVSQVGLASLLRQSTKLRFRRADGRFGTWESRPSPSAGGMSALRLLVLPLEPQWPGGLYDEDIHGLRSQGDLSEARALNGESVRRLCGATSGTTIQLLADIGSYEGCYENSASLVWRDAGALCAIVSLVATALSLCSVVLGRQGQGIIRAAGLPEVWQGAGAIHVSELPR